MLETARMAVQAADPGVVDTTWTSAAGAEAGAGPGHAGRRRRTCWACRCWFRLFAPGAAMTGSRLHETHLPRRFRSAVAAPGLAALAASLAPLRHLNDFPNVDQFLQKYYKELTREEMAKVLKRIEDEVEREYGLRPHVRDLKPMNGVKFVYALNLTRCIGCRKCVHACVAENNQSRTPEGIQYIRVVRLPHGSLDLDKAEHNYNPELVPEEGYFYMPVQCQQCKNPPCVKVCPCTRPGRRRTASRSLTTTGASVAGIAQPRVPIGPGTSTSRGLRFPKSG